MNESKKRRFFLIAMGISLFLIVCYLLIPLPDPLFPPDYSTVILDSDGRILRVFLNDAEQWCFPPAPDLRIPQKLKTAVLYYEDKQFYKHPGVNPFALFRALYQNLKSGEVVSGASTITMQLARIMRPKPRTYPNKLLEILQALKIEIRYSKNEILRAYLDHAPYGGNIVGFQAASYRYFGKGPAELTWSEAALLAVLPNAPGLISPMQNQQKLKQKRNRLLGELKNAGLMSQETCQLAQLEPLPNNEIELPLIAPHLTQNLAASHSRNLHPIRTTIKRDYQLNIEKLVQQHLDYLNQYGIRNGAALVAETPSGKIRAYIGSQDFFDTASQGQVDGVLAPRSTGSILKPFLYASSMDEGLVLPQSLINDIPTYFGSFSPANANNNFNGLVTVHEALTRSLNVPAVRLLNAYGLYPFYLFLQNAGMRTLFRRPDDYGLPLILGGAEANLWDLARLYRGLANYGSFSPLRVMEPSGDENASNPENVNKKLISNGASFLTLEILRDLKRPGAEYYWQQYTDRWPLAWKTGTSYGQRDAWAIGVSPQWTIAVWVGNFDGEPNGVLSGARCAGPLLFDIFNYLPKDPNLDWFKKPEKDLKDLQVCALSGFIAGADCPEKILVEAPSAMKPMKICPYHHTIFTDVDEKYQVCSLCWQPGGHIEKAVAVYPPEVVQYLRQRGQLVADIPIHNPFCPGYSEQTPLKIVYPVRNARLWIPRDVDGNLQKVTLRIAHRQPNRYIFWYLDHQYVGASQNNHTKALTLSAGWHSLEVVDEDGQRDSRRFYVAMKSE